MRFDESSAAYVATPSSEAYAMLKTEFDIRQQRKNEKHERNIRAIMSRKRWFEGWFGIKPYTYEEAKALYESDGFWGEYGAVETNGAYWNQEIVSALEAAEFAVQHGYPTVWLKAEVASSLKKENTL